MKKISELMKVIGVACLLSLSFVNVRASDKPNIVLIYVDDLGYGDLSCYGADRIQTPNVDALAENGLKFTDAHCAASTCTPSRFSMLTGSYAFRRHAEILDGDAPLLIDPAKGTLPKMLQKQGYSTAVVGKWHLGLGDGNTDWNDSIAPGPIEVGFDYSYIIPATPDRVPCVVVENHNVINLDLNDPIEIDYRKKVGTDPTGKEHPELIKYPAGIQHLGTIVNGVSRIGYMSGGNSARWKDETLPFLMLKKARRFMDDNQDRPFFLYFSLVDIHEPRMPAVQFQNKSNLGPRGDAILEMDWLTGEIVNYLDKLGLRENTIVIFSSDNGPVVNDGYNDGSDKVNGSHKPAGIYSGGKYSALEAGTRVPLVVNWPKEVQPGVSDALISQVDLYSSLANLLDYKLTGTEAPDSYDLLDAFVGKSNKGRRFMLEESTTLSLRDGDWKYIEPVTRINNWIASKGIDSGQSLEPQLYNLENDPSEKQNVASEYQKQLKKMMKSLDEITSKDKSRP